MHVVVLDDYQQIARVMGPWASLGTDVSVQVLSTHLVGDDLVAALREADVLVAMRERTALTRQILERLPRLKLIVTTGMVNQAIDFTATAELGVTVCGTRGLIRPTAELTWGLILSLVRRIPAEDAAIRSGGWQHTLGVGLTGKTLGVLGLGRLGSAVARVGLAFDMDVQAWSPNLTAQRCTEHGVRLVTKETLLSTSHIVTIHMVLSDATRGLVGRAEIESMRSDAVLVNTSRGPLIDEGSLANALRSGRIAGAALDVFDREPLPAGHPFRSLPNTVVTGHIGYVTVETMQIFYDDIVEDIQAFHAGTPIRVMTTADG